MPRYWTFAHRIFSSSDGVSPWNALVRHQSAIDAISHTNGYPPGAEARWWIRAASHSASVALTNRTRGTAVIIPPLDADDASKARKESRFRRAGHHRLDQPYRLGDRRHRFDAELLRAGWKQLDGIAPEQQGTRPRLGGDLEAVFGAIVHDDVDLERGRREPARPAKHEHGRQLEPVRPEPSLRLQLRDVALRVRPLREEYHLEPVLVAERGNPRDRARLDFLERAQEILRRGDALPYLAQLAAAEDLFLLRPRLHFRRIVGHVVHAGRCVEMFAPSRAQRHVRTEELLGNADQSALHVGDRAVKVEGHPQGHCLNTLTFFLFVPRGVPPRARNGSFSLVRNLEPRQA